MKSQGSAASDPETLQSQIRSQAQNRLSIRALPVVHRRLIGACVRTSESISRFRDDPSAIDDFLGPLVEGNIISSSEARLGLASPKLSKFGAIGHNAEVLCREQVFRYLPPGYTLIYQVTVLYGVLDGDDAHRLEQLVRELDALSPLSRERLIARTDEIKRAKKGAPTMPSASNAGRGLAPTDVDPIRNPGVADCNLGLITPDAQRDLSRLSEDYVEEPEFLRLARELLVEEAVAVVIARLADIPLIENKLLPILGFSYVSQVCCQSAFKFDPGSAFNFDPFKRRVLTVALASSELAEVAETWRARVA